MHSAEDQPYPIYACDALKPGESIQLIKCRMFGLINLVLGAIELNETDQEGDFYTSLNPVQRLFNASTIAQLENEIMSIIEVLISHNSQSEETIDQKMDHIERFRLRRCCKPSWIS